MKNYLLYLLFLSVAILTPMPNIAQRIETPDGEIVIAQNTFTGTKQNRISATRNTLYSSQYTEKNEWTSAKSLYETAYGVQIADLDLKIEENGDKRTIILLLNNGNVVIISYNALDQSASVTQTLDSPPATSTGFGGVSWQKILFNDKIYVRASGTIYSRLLSSDTWKKENVGLNNLSVQDIIIDAQNHILGGTNKGLFQLSSDGSGWNRITSYDTLTVSGLFQLRNGQYYLSGPRAMFTSASLNGPWVRDTSSLGTVTFFRMSGLPDGTIIGVANTGQGTVSSTIWKKEVGAAAWNRIDNSFAPLTGGPAPRVYDLACEQTIEIATAYSSFSSADKGAEWTHSTKGIMSEEIYGYAKTSDLSYISTNTGIFRKMKDKIWEKIYPSLGFLAARPLFHSTSPECVTLQLSATVSGQSVRHGAFLSSYDNGASWTADTIGLSAVPYSQQSAPAINVDNQGSKFIGITGFNAPVRVYSSSGSWALDTAGMNMASLAGSQICSAILTDVSVSNTYIAGGVSTNQSSFSSCFLFKKTRPSGVWTLDTAGLNNSIITAFASAPSDEMYGGSATIDGVSRIFHRSTNGWEQIPSPPTAISDVKSIGITANHSLYVAFSSVINSGTANKGVYVTDDNGKTWNYAGLDSVVIRGLIAENNEMYAFTNRGVYKLSKHELKSPKLTLDIHQIDFGSIEVGKTKDTIVTFGNTGNDTLRINNITSTLNEFSAIPSKFSVSPNGSISIIIHFAPTTAGDKSATLHTSGNSFPDSIIVRGAATASSTIKMALSAKILHFDTVIVGSNKDLYFTVKSEGSDTLRVLNILSTNTAFSISPLKFNLGAGDTQSVRVRFQPTFQGDRQGAIYVFSNAGNDTLRFDGTGADDISGVVENYISSWNVSLSPNPSNGLAILQLSLPREECVSAYLTDLSGRIIHSLFEEKLDRGYHEFPLSTFCESGVYYLCLHTSKGIATMKFVVTQ